MREQGHLTWSEQQMPAKTDQKQIPGRFKPGQSGNPAGRTAGSRNRATLALESLLDGEAEKITRKAIELAIAGDGPALRLCMERICPPRKNRPVFFALPKLERTADAVKAMAAIVDAVAKGELTPSEASELSKVIEGFTKAVEAHDFEERLVKLEARMK
jgi:Family of unknown function (DUF5681)